MKILGKITIMSNDILSQDVMDIIYENFTRFSILSVTSHTSTFVLGCGYDFNYIIHGSTMYTFVAMNRFMFVSLWIHGVLCYGHHLQHG
jgi:hypothetical protein